MADERKVKITDERERFMYVDGATADRLIAAQLIVMCDGGCAPVLGAAIAHFPPHVSWQQIEAVTRQAENEQGVQQEGDVLREVAERFVQYQGQVSADVPDNEQCGVCALWARDFAEALAATRQQESPAVSSEALREWQSGYWAELEQVRRLGRCVGFFASALKSGEGWTATCQAEYDAALASRAVPTAPAATETWLDRLPTRMVVCPDCGNKRCPKANDPANACTGSNAPGQPGSAYPAPAADTEEGNAP